MYRVIIFSLLLSYGELWAATRRYQGPLSFGKSAPESAFQGPGQTIFVDGEGLPAGQGNWQEGKKIYESQCMSCHGEKMEGHIAFNAPPLTGGLGTLQSEKPMKTVQSYWPGSVTLFDYIYRAMPFLTPKILSPDQVYSVSAYILGEAGIIAKDQVLNEKNFAEIQMPNRNGFLLPEAMNHLSIAPGKGPGLKANTRHF